jgi:protein-tyrosine phosphatase
MRQILFLCSGNCYRSRFAKHFFNWLAPQVPLAWRAESRGLRVGMANNVGPISKLAIDALQDRNIPFDPAHRYPLTLTDSDLVKSKLTIAMKEAEHRQLMEQQFPDWSGRITYWHADDLDCAGPEMALPLLEEKVRTLVARLQNVAETEQADVT